jgi:hypothetical protein
MSDWSLESPKLRYGRDLSILIALLLHILEDKGKGFRSC